MYSSCVRAAAVAALAVHVAAVIMTELLVLRLVVTEAGRNPELAHLEHSFIFKVRSGVWSAAA